MAGLPDELRPKQRFGPRNLHVLQVIYLLGYICSMEAVFEVIAEPNRRRILDLLLQRPRSVGELVDQLNVSQPATSKHLRVLRNAGLVRVRRDAQRRWYELAPEPLTEIDAWLEPYRRLWAARLDALERRLGERAESRGAPKRSTLAIDKSNRGKGQ